VGCCLYTTWLCLAALCATPAFAGSKPRLEPTPAASAAEIPPLADLLNKAGWTPTPELSGVFHAGSVFRADGAVHRLMVRSCFDATPAEDTYTAAEVVSQLQAGVRVRFGGGSVGANGELVKHVKFGSPVHTTLERLALVPTAACRAMLDTAPRDQLAAMYVVQEVLTAQIAEQTCGRIDASGRFVGIGSAEGEFATACRQESLEPVAVAYRVVPLTELLGDDIPREPAPPSTCPWGPIQSVSSAMTTLSVNGTTYDVRGLEARTAIIDTMQRCELDDAAQSFARWRAARRTTNVACATLVGCYPFAIGVVSGLASKRHRLEMEEALRTGMSNDERRDADRTERRAR
jgi:hypothetical protein